MVQNSQPAETISNPIVAKLLEVDSSLADQEAVLSAQLKSVQEKRRSLKTVIDLFTEADTTAASIAASAIAESNGTSTAVQPQDEVVGSPELVLAMDEAMATSKLESSQVATATDSSPTAKDATSPQAKKTPSATKTKQLAATKKTASTPESKATDSASEQESTQSPEAKSTSSASKTKQSAAAKKTAKKTERWQDYLREEFSNSTLSEAVAHVLQRQPEQVLEIAAVVDAIFVDKLPKQVRSTARERISNVLSDGVRKNKWYRGEAGSYSMSFASSR